MRSDSNAPGDGSVVEWAPFRLAPGTEESALLEASEALQRDFLRHQPGFVRRELLRDADGHWVDLVVWTDHSSAMAAMSAAGSSAVCNAYFCLMAGGDDMDAGTGVLHLQRVRAY
jgi:hypothetical protein